MSKNDGSQGALVGIHDDVDKTPKSRLMRFSNEIIFFCP